MLSLIPAHAVFVWLVAMAVHSKLCPAHVSTTAIELAVVLTAYCSRDQRLNAFKLKSSYIAVVRYTPTPDN